MKPSLWAAVILTLASAAASAAPIFYNVNLTIGAGTVTGFLETDGTIGTLTAANFLDWSLKITDGVDTPDTLTGANSAVTLQGSLVTATLNAILFNFSGPLSGSYFYIERTSGPADFVCFGPGGGGSYQHTCASNAGGYVESLSLNGTNLYLGPLTGTQAIATPEPGSDLLLAGGLMGLWVWRRAIRRLSFTGS